MLTDPSDVGRRPGALEGFPMEDFCLHYGAKLSASHEAAGGLICNDVLIANDAAAPLRIRAWSGARPIRAEARFPQISIEFEEKRNRHRTTFASVAAKEVLPKWDSALGAPPSNRRE